MKIIEHQANGINYYTLVNNHHMSVTIMDWGATITAIRTHDKDGNYENVVLGFDHGEDYLSNRAFFGASVVRVAGIIKNARWRQYDLTQNFGQHHLNGGNQPQIAFEPWFLEHQLHTKTQVGLVMQYITLDGENGYPGTMTITAEFILDDHGKLTISYTGKSDQETLFNPTSHNYFNLSGNAQRTINDEFLKINADEYAALNKHGLPTGKLPWVTDSPFDFREQVAIGPQIAALKGGLRHGFVLNQTPYPQVELLDRISGRKLSIQTNAPAVIVSSATNYRDDRYHLNGGQAMRSQLGLSIMPQKLPDAIHHKEFGSIIIPANVPVTYQTAYRFSNIYDV
ncbi:aldose epimerase family protein [Lactiplantibacillus modestisalitolerans]|uniref:Aldose epimerase family protein n=1 Tax=Lactiplantibacillus modestisalitolerans TaxID=1457219 RepID=A0ABV5WT37_9LACO|nr:aldose epimerase family protein [Lactiplantibacillus modestisalitolerans]